MIGSKLTQSSSAARSKAGEWKILPQAIIRQFTDEEFNHYQQPFQNACEHRRLTLSWPRSLPIE